MLLGQGTLRGGAFGQRWSLPGAPRIAGYNEITKAKPLFPKITEKFLLLSSGKANHKDAVFEAFALFRLESEKD